MGNAISITNQKGNANIVDVLHALSKMTMARSKTLIIWMILGETRTNTWWDNMMSNNSEWKENFRLSQPTSRLFLAAFCFSLSSVGKDPPQIRWGKIIMDLSQPTV